MPHVREACVSFYGLSRKAYNKSAPLSFPKQPPLIHAVNQRPRPGFEGAAELPCTPPHNQTKADQHSRALPSCPPHTHTGAERACCCCHDRRRNLLPTPTIISTLHTRLPNVASTMRQRPRPQRLWLLLLLLSFLSLTTPARLHDISRRRAPSPRLWLYCKVSTE